MDIAEIRLRCLQIVHRHDVEPERLVERAKVFEAYAVQQEAAPVAQAATQAAGALNSTLGLPKKNR